MLVDVHLLDAHTGERVVYHDGYDYQPWPHHDDAGYAVAYQYSDGNYGCDCNRGAFFARAQGGDRPDHRPCSNGLTNRFVVERILDRGTGEEVYADEAAKAA